MISAVVARAKNNVIGKANELPWYLPADLKHFKELTTGHTVIMGRATFESIIARLGHPLPERETIVITRDLEYTADGAKIAHTLDQALELASGSDVYIIGGAQIYALAAEVIDRWYVTEIDASIDGDVYLEGFDDTLFHEIERFDYKADEKNKFDYHFVTYVRN